MIDDILKYISLKNGVRFTSEVSRPDPGSWLACYFLLEHCSGWANHLAAGGLRPNHSFKSNRLHSVN